MKKKTRSVRVALVKAYAKWGDRAANIKLFEEMVLSVAEHEVDVVVSPECFLDGYMVRDQKRCTRRKLANRCVCGVSDPFIRHVRKLAGQVKSHIVFGASEQDKTGTIRNAAYLFGRKGEHIGTYYKVMPGASYEPGPALPVFDTDFGKVGIVICADRRWPETIRCLRLKGAEIILNPTWGMVRGLNTSIMQTRAYENGMPICFAHPGQGLICMQDGSIGAILESNVPGVLVHDIDLARNVVSLVNSEKASSNPIQNRRPELYGEILAKG